MIKRTIAICGLSLALLSNLNAAPAKTYHVTGPILELTDKTIVVQKGDERWEIARMGRGRFPQPKNQSFLYQMKGRLGRRAKRSTGAVSTTGGVRTSGCGAI